jgi:flagellar biosynthetic protein FliQ
MTPEMVVQILRDALMASMWLVLPLLAIGFLVGIVMSLIQIVTSIQDTAFATVPRLLAFLAGIVVLLPWMVNRSVAYTTYLFSDLSRYAR